MTMTMMTVNEELHVGISEYKIAQAPTRLITVGLGSCIGTIIYDEASHIGGLSHIMLPDSQPFCTSGNQAREVCGLGIASDGG